MAEIEWMLKEPGPLLLIEKEVFSQWRGQAGSSIGEPNRTDYARACAGKKGVSQIAVGESSAWLVTGNRIVEAGWLEDFDQGSILISSFDKMLPSDEELKDILSQASAADWKTSRVELTAGHIEFMLVAAVSDGPEVAFESLSVLLNPGVYQIKIAHYEDQQWCFDFYWLVPKNVVSGPAQARRAELALAKQQREQAELADVADLLQRRDVAAAMAQNHRVLQTTLDWSDAMVADGLAYFHSCTDEAVKDALLSALDQQAVPAQQRLLLSEYALQRWQRRIAQRLPTPAARAVENPVRSIDELLEWMIRVDYLDNAVISTMVDVVESWPLARTSYLQLLALPEQRWRAIFSGRLLATQIRQHQRLQDLQLLYRLFLGLEPTVKVDVQDFYKLLGDLAECKNLPLLVLDPPSLELYFGDFDTAMTVLSGYVALAKAHFALDPSQAARTWFLRLLRSRTASFATAINTKLAADSGFLQGLHALHTDASLQAAFPLNLELRAEIAAALSDPAFSRAAAPPTGCAADTPATR